MDIWTRFSGREVEDLESINYQTIVNEDWKAALPDIYATMRLALVFRRDCPVCVYYLALIEARERYAGLNVQ
jgi:hypothetical protein